MEKLNHPLYEPEPELSLMGLLGFTEADLAANREGYLTKQQRLRLNKDRALCRLHIVLGILVCIIGVAPAVSVSERIIFWVFGAAVAIRAWLKKKNLDDDLHKGDVQVVEGLVKLGKRMLVGRGSRDIYYLSLQGKSWIIQQPTFEVFKNGDPYAIYYAPHSKTILSAEWLGRREMSG